MIMFQVNKFLFTTKLARSYFKYTDSYYDTTKVLFPLHSRTILKVTGPDVHEFLQGLITNDMNRFKQGSLTMYAMFLNNKGRVLCDTLVYKSRTADTFMLECDTSVQGILQRHLDAHKSKRAVRIGRKTCKVWALITPPNEEIDFNDFQYNMNNFQGNINIYKDPRLVELGYRLITTGNVNQLDFLDALGRDTVVEDDERGYQILKYKLGVSEGAGNFCPGKCYPLENNSDYLQGVSFKKGCYVGKELTCSGYYGESVIRERIMPVKAIEPTSKEDLHYDAPIYTSGDHTERKCVGYLKNYIDGYGLALVRIEEALAAKTLRIGLSLIELKTPAWWPSKPLKEKDTISKPIPVTIPEEPAIQLESTECCMNENGRIYGINVPFCRNIIIMCPKYVMKHPCSPTIGKGEIVFLGPHYELFGSTVRMNKDFVKQDYFNKKILDINKV